VVISGKGLLFDKQTGSKHPVNKKGFALIHAQEDGSINNLIIRVMLGIVIFPHGVQKLFVWFGGYGLEGILEFLKNQLGVPMIVALLVILVESLGALGLIT
jgi:uncharacterized membrane protein YphA (DoxX/SURF4 family)